MNDSWPKKTIIKARVAAILGGKIPWLNFIGRKVEVCETTPVIWGGSRVQS